jgi:hypothetical protein
MSAFQQMMTMSRFVMSAALRTNIAPFLSGTSCIMRQRFSVQAQKCNEWWKMRRYKQ